MDEIKPTPRNKLTGLLADALQGGLEFATNNGKNKPMNLLAELLALPAIQKTADRLSYGEPLTSGKGFTTRLQPETFDAAMGVLPFVGSAGRGANMAAEGINKGAAMIGKAAMPSTNKFVDAVMSRGGLPAQLMQDMAQGTKSPAIVWHGSPHKFDAFDSSKIGTGEGAQAYGHGLYLAENPSVAREYQEKLSSTGSAKRLVAQNGGVDSGLIEAQRKVDAYKQLISNGGGGDINRANSMLRIAEKQLQDISAMKAGLPENTGSLYKVDLPDEHIAKMLDWDKPLSQQSKEVRTAIEKTKKMLPPNALDDLGGDLSLMYGKDVRPQDFLNTWESFGAKTGGENALKELGIPGIRYLDGGSRGAGQGSSNYVVFPGNERLLNILERNGESVAPKYPQSQALELAQQRAALPISENGLGLPANNTAADRANVMGAEFGWGHGSSKPDIKTLKSSSIGAEGKGAYATDYLPETGVYAGTESGATSYPLAIFRDKTLNVPAGSTPYELLNATNDAELAAALKNKNLDSITAMQKPTEQWLIDAGAENLPTRNHFVSENPDNFRSRFAAFDPWRRNAAIAATMGVAAPDLLANPLDDKNNRLIDILRNK